MSSLFTFNTTIGEADLDWDVDIDRENRLVRLCCKEGESILQVIVSFRDATKLALSLRDAVAEIDRGK